MVLSDGMYTFKTFDYGTSHSFKLYDRTQTAFVATDYVGYIKFFDSKGWEQITEISPGWTSQATGAGTFAFTSSNYLGTAGRYLLECQLEKSGEIRSFRCIHPIEVIESPTGSRTP